MLCFLLEVIYEENPLTNHLWLFAEMVSNVRIVSLKMFSHLPKQCILM